MAQLNEQIQNFIVAQLACYLRPTQIVAARGKEIGLEVKGCVGFAHSYRRGLYESRYCSNNGKTRNYASPGSQALYEWSEFIED